VEVFFLACGAGGPQPKRNPLGNSLTTLRAYTVFLTGLLACGRPSWPAPPPPSVTPPPQQGAIVGTVVDWLDGKPIARSPNEPRIEAQSTDARWFMPTLDTRGTYAITGLLPGHYRISVRAVGYLPLNTTCEVTGGHVDTLILMLDRAAAGPVRVRPLHDRYAKVRPGGKAC